MVRKMDLGSIRHFWNKKSKDFFVRKRYPVIFGGIVAEVVLLDQLTKWLIISLQPQWHTRFVSINYIQNTGAGFGILQGQTLTLAILSIIIGIVLIGSYNKIDKKLMPQLLFALFLPFGATTNEAIFLFFCVRDHYLLLSSPLPIVIILLSYLLMISKEEEEQTIVNEI